MPLDKEVEKAIERATQIAKSTGHVAIPDRRNLLFQDIQRYRRLASNNQNIICIRGYKNAVCVREIRYFPEKDNIIVEEYELTEDKKTGKKSMQIIYCNVHKKANYARSDFVGRVCSLAYEHSNNELQQSEFDNMFVQAAHKGK